MSNLNTQVTITEKQILHAWYDNPDLFDEDDTLFISEIALEFQYILEILKSKGLNFIEEHILKESIHEVNVHTMNSILETEYQLDKLDTYKIELTQYKAFTKLQEEIIKEVSQEITKKGTKNIAGLEKLYDEFGDALDKIKEKDKGYLTFSDMLEEHKPTMDMRANRISQTTGCFNFDKILGNIFAGIALLVGYSGSMKSTIITYLAKQRLIKRLPTIFINTELVASAVVDGLTPSMMQIPYTDVLGIGDENMIDFSKISDEYDKLHEHFLGQENFLMFPGSSASISDLKTFIVYARKSMNLRPEEILFCYVDLLSMISDFSGGNGTKADTIEEGLNNLNSVCLSENCFLLGSVQLKRMATNIVIEREEDIEKYAPNLSSIKSSGAWEERSRLLIGIHNPYHICMKSQCNEVIRSLQNPVVKLRVLKDSYTGHVGEEIQYWFSSEYKSLLPYEDEEL